MDHIELLSIMDDLNNAIQIAQEELDSLIIQRFEVMLSLRDQGVPLRVIGSLMNVSRQRAKQLLDAYELSKLRQNQRSS